VLFTTYLGLIKPRRTKLAWHVARMGKRNAYKKGVEKVEGISSLESPGLRW
jgi:hypothetical protein